MSLFDLQDVCIAIGSIETLDLPMVVDLIGIYGLKGPYCTLTTANWFFVGRRPLPSLQAAASAAARLCRKIVSGQFDEENPFVQISSVLLVQADEGVSFLVVDRIGDFYRNLPRRADVIVTTVGARHKCQQVLLVQADEGFSFLIVDRIGDFYRNLLRRADVIVTTVGARHKCQQAGGRIRIPNKSFSRGVQSYFARAKQPPETTGIHRNSSWSAFPPTKLAGAAVDVFSTINDPLLPAATITKGLLTLSQNGFAATKPNDVA
ncbi:protease Do-like 2, chloroplastic [Dorcoceras hygrometricum]|uniref:Protease Do-like 2, chloroplastic n=1 Tax=Dorcoceras hygrometricum TaxID=472368 RepID=A0A2Z7CDC5_9LAMI|nr:protease Do-like 2, chloroplastic [Dorcoceras hygrometricum]